MRRRSIVSGYTALPYSIYLPKLKIINLFVVFWATMVSLPILSFSRNILTASQLKLKFEFYFNDRLSAYCNFLLLPKEKKSNKEKNEKKAIQSQKVLSFHMNGRGNFIVIRFEKCNRMMRLTSWCSLFFSWGDTMKMEPKHLKTEIFKESTSILIETGDKVTPSFHSGGT